MTFGNFTHEPQWAFWMCYSNCSEEIIGMNAGQRADETEIENRKHLVQSNNWITAMM